MKDIPYIELHVSHIEVHNYEYDEEDDPLSTVLNRLIKYDKVAHQYTDHIWYIDQDILYVPTGVSVSEIKLSLENAYGEEIKVINKMPEERFNIPRKNNGYDFLLEPRNELQLNAVNFLGEIENTKNNPAGQRILDLNTGDGKTFVALNYASKAERIPMIICGRNNIIKQWHTRIREYTGLMDENIYIISGEPTISKLKKMNLRDIKKIKYFLAMTRTVELHLDDVNNLMDRLGVSVKIFDEAHENYISNFMIDSKLNVPSIYLTATFQRSDMIENRIMQNEFQNVQRFSESTILDNGNSINNPQGKDKYRNVVIARYKSRITPAGRKSINKKSMMRGFNNIEYSKRLLSESYEEFWKRLNSILSSWVYNTGAKTLILVSTIDLVEQVTESIENVIPDNLTVSKYHGKVSKSDKLKALNSNIIVSTEKSFSTGVDVKGLRLIISTINTRSETLVTQMAGRLRRPESGRVIYVDLVDDSIPMIVNQLSSRKRYYSKFARSIQETKMYEKG